MSKGKTPRFTRRVRKDISGIKARSQTNHNLAKNRKLDRWNKSLKRHEIPDFNLLKLIILLRPIYF